MSMRLIPVSVFAALAGFLFFAGVASAAYYPYPCATLSCGQSYDAYYGPGRLDFLYTDGFGYPGGYQGGLGGYYGGYGGGYYGAPMMPQMGGYGGASSYANSGLGSYYYGAPQIMAGLGNYGVPSYGGFGGYGGYGGGYRGW